MPHIVNIKPSRISHFIIEHEHIYRSIIIIIIIRVPIKYTLRSNSHYLYTITAARIRIIGRYI